MTQITGPEAITIQLASAPSGRVIQAFYPCTEGVCGLRDYETVIIWSASIPEGDIEKGHDRVVEIIKGDGGTYIGSDKWSRRILAYPIKKQTEGIYHFLKWNGGQDVTSAIDKHLKINENCLRYLTLRSDGEELSSWEDKMDDDSDDIVEEDMESEDQ